MTEEDSLATRSLRDLRAAVLVDAVRLYEPYGDRNDVIRVWKIDGGFVAEMGGLTADWRDNQNYAGSVAWTCWLADIGAI